MPLVNSDDNRIYSIQIEGVDVTLKILKHHPAPWYFVALVDGETVESHASSEGEAYRMAFDGAIFLLKSQGIEDES